MSVDTGGQWGCWDISTAETGGRCYRTRLAVSSCLWIHIVNTGESQWRADICSHGPGLATSYRSMLASVWKWRRFCRLSGSRSPCLEVFDEGLSVSTSWRGTNGSGRSYTENTSGSKSVWQPVILLVKKMTIEYDGLPGRNQKAQLLK